MKAISVKQFEPIEVLQVQKPTTIRFYDELGLLIKETVWPFQPTFQVGDVISNFEEYPLTNFDTANPKYYRINLIINTSNKQHIQLFQYAVADLT